MERYKLSNPRLVAQILNFTLAFVEILVILSICFPTLSIYPLLVSNLMRGATHASNVTSSGPYMSPLYFLGWLLAFVGGIVRVWCYKEMGHFFTFTLAIRSDHRLIKTGPYAYIRHPSYTALMSVMIGFGIYQLANGSGSWLTECSGMERSTMVRIKKLAVGYSVIAAWAVVMRSLMEDKMMRKVFSREWVMWTVDVPYRLIPGVF